MWSLLWTWGGGIVLLNLGVVIYFLRRSYPKQTAVVIAVGLGLVVAWGLLAEAGWR